MKIVLSALLVILGLFVVLPTARAAPCLIVTVTGSGGGPPTFNGLAGPGTLLQYGDDGNNCDAVRMQFDAGRPFTCARTIRIVPESDKPPSGRCAAS